MQKLQLSIPEPCHENWQQMTPTEQGRFCNTCAKEVVDFSTMTDIQVLNYFTNLAHEKVCGRALPEQLDRTISRPEPPKKKLFWYWNYIMMFLMFFKGNGAAAQTTTKPQTEISPLQNGDIRGKIAVNQGSRVVIGKITDTDGNPVSFASVKIKGTESGVSADANGTYSIRVMPGAVLIITAAAYTATEVPTGTVSVLNTVMDKSDSFSGEIVITGAMVNRNTDDYYGREDKPKRVAVIQVKDETTGKLLQASLVLQSKQGKTTDTVVTDKNGRYKLKGIMEYDKYNIKVSAEGFEPAEFSISEYDFKERKKEWEVLLRKEKTVNTKQVILCAKSTDSMKSAPLFIVDGVHIRNGMDIKPEDVEEYSVLGSPEATVLFGQAGANGAVVVTTRKSKEMQLEEVTVTAEFGVRRVAGGMMGVMTIANEGNILKEKIVTFKTQLTDSIQVFPNPVQPNSDFSVRLKLKQPGTQYSMLITDAVGKVLLQQKISAAAKEHTEKIAADGRWAAGIYYIRVFDMQNKLVSKSSFIYR